MYSVFFKIFLKTCQMIKQDPIICLPYVMLQMGVILVTHMSFPIHVNKDSLVVFGLIEWLLPVLVIQPIIILMGLRLVQKKKRNGAQNIAIYTQSLWPFFVVSLLNKPMYLVSVKMLMGLINKDTADIAFTGDVTLGMGLFFGSIMIGFLILFFQPYYYTTKKVEPIMAGLTKVVRVILQFKWIVLSFVLHYFMIVFFVQTIGIGAIASLFPTHVALLFVAMISGIERTLFQLFILRIYLYIKPLI
jgi:hypothetical protein